MTNRIPFCGLLLLIVTFGFEMPTAHGDIIRFMATGNAGEGLLAGNVNPVAPTDPGSGGIGSSGIFLDTETNTLFVDIEWGSLNGYTDMSGPVTMVHLHGMTANPAPESFSQVNSNILVNLGNTPNFDDTATDGGLAGSFFIGNPDIQGLLEGRTYINVHTDLNTMGEIRGYLVVAIPEPATGIALGTMMVLFIGRQRIRSVKWRH